jgi:hypothetical protein
MEENFTINNDKTADWALNTIHEAEAERDRLIALAEEQIKDLTGRIEELKEKCENETKFLRSCLQMYFNTIESKETKTQRSYKLLAGTLVLKKPSQKITHDDGKLLEYLEKNDGAEYIKVKKSVDWAEFKKTLTIANGKVVDTDLGEIIPEDVCGVEEVPETFTVKF